MPRWTRHRHPRVASATLSPAHSLRIEGAATEATGHLREFTTVLVFRCLDQSQVPPFACIQCRSLLLCLALAGSKIHCTAPSHFKSFATPPTQGTNRSALAIDQGAGNAHESRARLLLASLDCIAPSLTTRTPALRTPRDSYLHIIIASSVCYAMLVKLFSTRSGHRKIQRPRNFGVSMTSSEFLHLADSNHL